MAAESTMQEAVQRGFTWLKEEGPALGFEWERVRIHHLHMGSNVLCVLAQATLRNDLTFGELVREVIGESRDWIYRHGFAASVHQGGFRALTAEWVRVLTEARDEQDQADIRLDQEMADLAEALLVS